MQWVFGLVVFSIFAAGGAYMAWRLGARRPRWARWLIWALTGAAVVLQPIGFALTRSTAIREPLVSAVLWASTLAMGLFALLFAGVLALELWRLLLRLGGPADPARRQLLLGVAEGGVLAGAGVLAAAGVPEARRVPPVSEVEIPVEGLDPSLQGFRIAQISDVHIGPTITGEWLREVVGAVNELAPDLIAVTGDLVDGSVEGLGADVAPLADLRARHGAFFVTGNHEYYSGVDEWVAEVRRLGLTVLLNAHSVIEHDGARMVVAGVTDHSAGRRRPDHAEDPAAAVAGAPEAAFRLLLAHQPRSAFAAASVGGFDLQLSGHTHGGQFFPFTFIVRWVQPFAVGLHRLGKMWIYTNRGTGYWGPPMRVGSPPEITLLRLVAAD